MKYFPLEISSGHMNTLIYIKYVSVHLLLGGQLYPVEEN